MTVDIFTLSDLRVSKNPTFTCVYRTMKYIIILIRFDIHNISMIYIIAKP